GLAGVLVSSLRRLPFVLEIRDLWPESIVAVGAMRPSRAVRLLEWLERRMYAAATRIVTVGEGYRRKLAERGVAPEGVEVVPNVVFTGRLDKARMPEVLAAADACLVHLRKTELFQSVLPSKIFEAAAMARPIVLGVEGFAAELVAGAGAGLCIEPENERELSL